MKLIAIMCAAPIALFVPTAASAGEVFGGVHVHDVKTPLDKSGIEDGVDFSLGYTGDSVINSLSDILMMVLGFLLARKLPLWAAALLLLALEVIPLFAIRDNLTLNVWALIAPSHAVQAWQAVR